MNVDEVRVGRYQVLTLLMLAVNLVIVGMSHALGIFYKHKPEFHCQDDVTNGTSVASCPSTSRSSSSCTLDAGVDNRTSVAGDWSLICDREPLLRASGDVYFGGMLLGGVVAGLLMDRIGRMPILAICLYAQGTMAVALNIVKHYELFLVFRGLQGFFMQGLESSTYVLGIELFPSKYRAAISLIILSARSVGFAALAGLNYLILDWRVLQLVVSIPTTLTVLYIWLIPESARWLLARDRASDAEAVIDRIANYNNRLQRAAGKEAPLKPKRKVHAGDDDNDAVEKSSAEEAENLLDTTAVTVELRPKENNGDTIAKASRTNDITSLDENDDETDNRSASKETLSTEVIDQPVANRERKSAIYRFFEARFIGRTCLVLLCLWFACSLTFHGLVTLPSRMRLDRHASLAIAGLIEIVTFLVGYALMCSRLGRRTPLCVGQTIAATVCFAMAILSLTLPGHAPEAIAQGKVIIVKIGSVANIICFFVLRILTIELFPTISRGTGLGLCIAAEMFGGLITPLIMSLNNYVADKKLDVARMSIGIFCICVAFLTLILSETVNLNVLPDSVEDAEALNQKRNNEKINNEEVDNERSSNPEKLRKKLFSEDWVDAGNGIIVNFVENKTVD